MKSHFAYIVCALFLLTAGRTFAENPQERPDIAIAIVVDVSGSMGNAVKVGNRKETKYTFAVEALRSSIELIKKEAALHPERKIALGIYSFDHKTIAEYPITRIASDSFIMPVTIRPGGGDTYIGNALQEASKGLIHTGYPSNHIILISDGENRGGEDPGDVLKSFQDRRYPNRNNPKAPTPDRSSPLVSLLSYGMPNSDFERYKSRSLLFSMENDVPAEKIKAVLTGMVLQALGENPDSEKFEPCALNSRISLDRPLQSYSFKPYSPLTEQTIFNLYADGARMRYHANSLVDQSEEELQEILLDRCEALTGTDLEACLRSFCHDLYYMFHKPQLGD